MSVSFHPSSSIDLSALIFRSRRAIVWQRVIRKKNRHRGNMRRIGRESHLNDYVSTHALSLTRASSFDSASRIRWMGFTRNFHAQKKTSRVYVSCFKPSNTIWRNSRLRRADNESNFRNFSLRVCHHVCGLDGNKINFRHFNEGTGTRFNYCLFSARVSLGLFLRTLFSATLFLLLPFVEIASL